MLIRPSTITGIWNFRIKEVENNGAKISLFLSNTKAKQTDNHTSETAELILKVISSGEFENQFSTYINK